MNALAARFEKRFGSSSLRHFSLDGRGGISLGFESVSAMDAYRWEGLRRSGDARKPQWLLQYTLAGWGLFEAGGVRRRVSVGQAFCAKIPSRHGYENDPACEKWTFFWVMINQPYVVSRLLGHANLVNAVISPGERSPSLQAIEALFLQLGKTTDSYNAEESLFHCMLELERWAFASRHPVRERERLLNFARSHVLERLTEFVPIEELADACRMSRSNFTHHFRRVTGLTPAAFVREIRLREAIRLLGHKSLSVKEVAVQTGFADANHLCKCFRAHLQTSPGTYRRLQPAD